MSSLKPGDPMPDVTLVGEDGPVRLRDFVGLYVQNTSNGFYYTLSCLWDDERSETSRRHDDRPTTDCVSASHGRHEAWSKPVPCLFARTAD